jgi:hypothetical protein
MFVYLMGWQVHGRGVIIDLGGIIEIDFARGFSILSNNQAKAYTLLQGLRISNDFGINSLIVVDTSKTIISYMTLNYAPVDNSLASVIATVKQEAKYFNKISFYHVLWENNYEANLFANIASTLKMGVFNVNDTINQHPIHNHEYKDMY